MSNQTPTPSNPPYVKGEGRKDSFPLDARGIKGVIEAIEKFPPKHFRYIIGIDGLGASGKSTLAEEIKKLHPQTSIIHTDEFYKPFAERDLAPLVNGATVSVDFDWDRLDAQVIQPVLRGLLVKYQSYDWRADTWGPWIEIPESNWIIIVGVYALQSRFFSYYDYSIWCELSHDERIARMTEREGLAVTEEWQQQWLPREEHYLEVDHPDKRASICLTT